MPERQTEPGRQIVSYEAGPIELKLRFDRENQTVWATQAQIASLFGCSETNVTHHIKNIFDDGELDGNATTEKISVVQPEGGREVSRNVLHYDLDVILSVGYRVNSLQATKFRQWAAAALRDYIVNGFSINTRRLAEDVDA